MPFWKRGKDKGEERPEQGNRSFSEFLRAAKMEMERLMEEDPRWFYHLPYTGAMSQEEAKALEIEKRALWRRVIFDAKRSKLPGLRWETRRDDRVCDQCRSMDNRLFSLGEYDRLNEIIMHIGCRCTLTAVRE
jgi:hypothetical protein